MSINAIKNTIFDTVLAAYGISTDHPSSSPYQNQQVFVSRLWPGQIIDENQYGNAWSPTNTNGIMAATENLSILVDPIPTINDWHNKSGRNVEEMYRFMLNSVDLIGNINNSNSNQEIKLEIELGTDFSSKIEAELAKLKTVEVQLPNKSKVQTVYLTSEAIDMKNLEIAHSNAAAAVLAERLALEKVYKEEKTDVKNNPKLEKLKSDAWKELQAATKSSLKLNLETIKSATTEDSFHEANLLFSRSSLASVRNPGIAYHPSYTSPENWVDPTSKENWPSLTIPVAGTAPEISLSITFSRIDITRPWLIASLFDLKNWKNSQGAGSFSNGTLLKNNGTFALLPQSMIVARDIVAKTSNSEVFKSKGLQILAFISKIVPYSPPL